MASVPELIWLMRHAETAVPGVFHGAESDVELSARGREQALALIDHFRGLPPTVVVSSQMKRAVETARPTAQHFKIPHEIVPTFHERQVGVLSGTDFTASGGLWAQTIQEWSQGNTAFTTEGAESFDDIQARVLGAWEQLCQSFAGERVLLVAHGVVCKVLLLSLLSQYTPADWRPLGPVANCAITTFRWVGSWQADSLLQIPPAVLAVSGGHPTGIGTQRLPPAA